MNEADASAWWDTQAATIESAKRATSDHWDAADVDEYVGMIDRALGVELAAPKACALDLGCGIGRLTLPVAARWPDAMVVGLDVSEAMIRHARVRALATNVAFGGMNMLPESWASACWSILVLQHLPRPEAADLIARAAYALRPSGRFLLQFVEGDIDVPLTHNYRIEDIIAWCDTVNLEVDNAFVHAEGRVMRPEWTWATAIKRGTR